MKHWQETRQIFSRATELLAVDERCAVGTVVAISGSAYRRPGAKLLIDPGGRTWGGVSGGCLEDDVREVALRVIESGDPVVRRYETGSDEDVVWGLGLGCDGSVEILVQPLSRHDRDAVSLLRAALDRLEGREPFAIATFLDGPDPPTGTSAVVGAAGAVAAGSSAAYGRPGGAAGRDREPHSGGDPEPHAGRDPEPLASLARGVLRQGASALAMLAGARVFIDAFRPPEEVILCGAGDDAVPLAAFAARAGFRVTVSDHRPAYLTRERFPAADLADPETLPPDRIRGAYGVVLTHNLERDRGWAETLVNGGAAYVGLLGPRARRDDIMSGIGGDASARIYGPVGLDIGADGPEQVALSVVAEMLAVRAGREPRHLRHRERPIHERPAVLADAPGSGAGTP